jgi:predicted cation transporter
LRPDQQEFADGVKLAAIAAVSAVLTATVVIGAGRVLLPQGEPASAAERPELIRAALR